MSNSLDLEEDTSRRKAMHEILEQWPGIVEFEQQSSVPFDGKFLRPGSLVGEPSPQMPLIDAIGTRRSSRAYREELVDRKTFDWLVSMAMNAPTACNEQQWKIVHIQDKSTIEDLYERGSAAFLKNVNQCFLICYNKRNDNPHWRDYVQSGSAFATTFQLLAHSIGIGSCWICHLPNRSELKRMFGIHRAYEPVCLISYGYYRGKTRVIPRKFDASKVIMNEKFDSRQLVFASHRKTLIRLVLRFIYYKTPPFLRRKLRQMSLRHEKKFYYEQYD
jgi:nitroreductase